ncbi:hypothetical protein BH10BAC2_BH10BAC2_21230 [soil metagenome]
MKHFQQHCIIAAGIINIKKLMLPFVACLFAQYIFAQPGTLDSTFGYNGEVAMYGADEIYGSAVAIQSDGKIVVAGGTSFNCGMYDNCGSIQLYRYNSNGSWDGSFGYQGVANVFMRDFASSSKAIAIQTDGKILVAGAAYYGDGYDNWKSYFAVARINTNGSIDTSFGDNGFALTSVRKKNVATSVAIQSDGKIVISGYSTNGGSSSNIAIVRYNINGSIDSSFNADGIITTAVKNASGRGSIAIQIDGRIVVAGSEYNGSNYDIVIVRYNTNGSLNKSFGSDGIVTTDFGSNDIANSLAIGSDGKILIAGYISGGVLVRYNSDGSIDSSFDYDGKITTGIEYLSVNSISVQPDEKVLLAGYTGLSYLANDCALLRYNTDGSADSTFGVDGVAMAISPDGFDYLMVASAVQKDFKIIVAGSFYDGYEDVEGMALIRFNGDGAYFSVSSKISYIGNPVIFTDISTNTNAWKWDFNGDGVFDSEEQNPQYSYSSAGTYNVKLRVNDNALLEKIIPITILPNRGTPYTLNDGGNFENKAADFAADNNGTSAFSRGNSIQLGKDGTHSGSNAWVLDINNPEYASNSTAYLYSPSYNCTADGNYTISFYAKYWIENTWDGFRLEYSTDKGNNWQILGNTVQANWYDYNSPDTDRPFPQDEAYFSLANAPSYQKKTFTTNIFQGNSSVAFRVVFKSDAFEVDAGLAIDDFILTGPTNIVLPVTLVSFSGYNNGNKNILNWKTSTELNSSRYEIERSFDTRNFEKIGTVLSINSPSGSSYTYTDDISHIYTNNFYYSLKMINKDGAYNYSPVVSINLRNRNEKITLLGNVTSSYINIITPATLLQKSLQAVFINMNGTVVKTINISNTSTIMYVDKLAAGKYFINFISGGKIIQTDQILKQ